MCLKMEVYYRGKLLLEASGNYLLFGDKEDVFNVAEINIFSEDGKVKMKIRNGGIEKCYESNLSGDVSGKIELETYERGVGFNINVKEAKGLEILITP